MFLIKYVTLILSLKKSTKLKQVLSILSKTELVPLQVKCIETAIECRQDSCTDFEAFKYIMVVRLGDFHMEMNMVIKSIQKLMPSDSSRDSLSLSYFSQRIMISHLLSNKPNKIKQVGKYEIHKQFILAIAKELLYDVLPLFFCEHIEDIKVMFAEDKEKAKFYIKGLVRQFLIKYKLSLWYDPEMEFSYHDDLHKYTCDTASRGLLLMAFSHAIKYGDSTCIRACHRFDYKNEHSQEC